MRATVAQYTPVLDGGLRAAGLPSRYSERTLRRPSMKSVLALILCLAVGVAVVAQQAPITPDEAARRFPYPPVRDQRGVIPPGPKLQPYVSPPLGDGPFAF